MLKSICNYFLFNALPRRNPLFYSHFSLASQGTQSYGTLGRNGEWFPILAFSYIHLFFRILSQGPCLSAYGLAHVLGIPPTSCGLNKS